MVEMIFGFVVELGKDMLMVLGACDVVFYVAYKAFYKKNKEDK